MNHPTEYYTSVPRLALPEGEDNNQKFNALLNSCQNPRAIYNALAALTPGMQAPCEPRINILKAVMNHRHPRNTQ